MAECTVESDSVPQRKRRKVNKMAEYTVESNSVPELPLVVLTKVASMLQRRGVEGWVFGDPLQLAAVSRQLRQAVLSSIQQMKRRHMRIGIDWDYVRVANVIVMNELRSAYTQMDCVDALLAFAQPNSLRVDLRCDGKLLSHDQILMRSLPLSLISLVLVPWVEGIGVDSPFDQILTAVASKTNLETLKIDVNYLDHSVAATHKNSSPSVPKDSPFNHLLTLKNLRTLCIDANDFLSPAQKTDLLERSQSKITHICCREDRNTYCNELFKALSDVVRGNIVSICCGSLPVFQADQFQFLARLPNCATIHFDYICEDYVNRQQLDELGAWLLDVCCADDVHPGRTLECSVGCIDCFLHKYVEEGGETQIEFTRGDTVVRLSIGFIEVMKHKHCPFRDSPRDYL